MLLKKRPASAARVLRASRFTRRRGRRDSTIFLASIFIGLTIMILNIIMMLNNSHSKNILRSQEQSFTITLADNPFCNSLKGALSHGPENRTMIHTFVSNAGHFPFLHNALLSMRRNGMHWTPLVLSMGEQLCTMLANMSELGGNVICVPYLERHLEQLQRDEPESMKQIQDFIREDTAVSSLQAGNDKSSNNNSNSSEFQTIDTSFYGWGAVAHKFLINSKLYALRDVLECGADAFITDTDIGFRKDPRPFFAISGPKGDIIAQNDTNPTVYELNINSGFMYWKRTDQNLDLIHDIITVPPFWHVDQVRVNTRMYKRNTPHTILDTFLFPNGAATIEMMGDSIILHANWNDKQHEKENMLKRANLWFLE
ncbi:hypothetical protein ACHAWT_001673 [Skeletonema menzelii]